jgi:hypothetical protein
LARRFRRDDIADRLLIFEVERRDRFKPESQLLSAITKARPAIWLELLTKLNKIVAAINKDKGIKAVKVDQRLADFASLSQVIAKAIRAEGTNQALAQMEGKRNTLLLQDDPLIEALNA